MDPQSMAMLIQMLSQPSASNSISALATNTGADALSSAPAGTQAPGGYNAATSGQPSLSTPTSPAASSPAATTSPAGGLVPPNAFTPAAPQTNMLTAAPTSNTGMLGNMPLVSGSGGMLASNPNVSTGAANFVLS